MLEEIGIDVAKALGVVILAIIARALVGRLIKRLTTMLIEQKPDGSSRFGTLIAPSATARARHEQRVRTVGSLLRNVGDVVITLVAILTVLAIFDIPMGPLLASAGIGGVAIGFGAQSLVKDYLSGIFMLAEDQFGVGDLVEIGDIRGTVEQVTLRVTKLRDAAGVLWYIRNGEVLTLGNVSQGTTSAIVDIPIAPDEDVDRAVEVLRSAVEGMDQESEYADVLIATPTVLGVGAIDASQVTLQVSINTAPNQQWGVARDIRRRGQAALVKEGIRGPRLPGGQPR